MEAETQQRSRRRARQSIREYELMVDLVAAAALACSVLASLAFALHAASTARPRHGSCQTLITLTRRPLSVSRALHVLRNCVLCLAPAPAVDLLEALGRCVCVRDGLAASVCVYRTSAASVEPLPRCWRAVPFPRWLHILSSKLLDVAHCSLLHQLLCFGFSGANSNSIRMNSIHRAASSRFPSLASSSKLKAARHGLFFVVASALVFWLQRRY